MNESHKQEVTLHLANLCVVYATKNELSDTEPQKLIKYLKQRVDILK